MVHNCVFKNANIGEVPVGSHVFEGIAGYSGDLKCLSGFAAASKLCEYSFADVLDEGQGTGYQRRFNEKHSLDFRKYIQTPGSTTIPLTFNLRPEYSRWWKINYTEHLATVEIHQKKVLSQVDCQHRLGFLSDLDLSLPFIIFIGLNANEEMAVFNIINSKSKGLSSSLLDYHEGRLSDNLEIEKPELLIALRLNEERASPWHKQLDLGGNRTSGLKRKASLRTIQKSVRRFLRETDILSSNDCNFAFNVILSFWQAVSALLETQWSNPRKHMLNKGVGVYSLMTIAADIYRESNVHSSLDWNIFFKQNLSDFVFYIDWSNTGLLKGLGGEAGVGEAVFRIRNIRSEERRLRVI